MTTKDELLPCPFGCVDSLEPLHMSGAKEFHRIYRARRSEPRSSTGARNMTLDKAIEIVTALHTRLASNEWGFELIMAADWKDYSQSELVEAWKALRARSLLQPRPQETKR